MLDKLPSDPLLCLSVVNTKLRDLYPSVDALCADLNLDKVALIDRLKAIDYEYDSDRNQFV